MGEYYADDGSGMFMLYGDLARPGRRVAGAIGCHAEAIVKMVYEPFCPVLVCTVDGCKVEKLFHGGGCQGGEACRRLGMKEKKL